MIDYRKYTATDFATDPVFRSWTLDQNSEAAAFWQNWLTLNPDRKEELEDAQAFLLALVERTGEVNETEIGKRVDDTLALIREGQRHEAEITSLTGPWYAHYTRMAAVICIALGLGWAGTRFLQRKTAVTEVATVRYYKENEGILKINDTQKPVTIRLEDSSTVILKPNSQLEYPRTFAVGKREVYLKGEAFFQITPNPNRPFVVLTEELVTQVLGTSFTVRSFEKDRNASVSVKTGRVSVYSKQEEQSAKESLSKEIVGVVLRPNQQVVFDKAESRLIKAIVTAPERISEIPAAELVFDEVPVKNVFNTLQHEYGIEILFNEETLSACMLTANLSGLPMYEQLDLICKIIKARYEMIDGQVVIHSEGCHAIQ